MFNKMRRKIFRLEELPNANKVYYFDNNASTYVSQEVQSEIDKWLSCGNPSNVLHQEGMKARQKIEDCRKIVADDLHVDPSEIIFTSGATESNNIIIQGMINKFLEANKSKRFTIITSNIEHPSVLNVFKHLENNPRIDVKIIPIRNDPNDEYYGSIHPDDVEKTIKESKNPVIFMSIMHINNETGAVMDLEKIGEIAKKHNVYFHSDATQSIGKEIIHPKDMNVSAISFSGHKFHAPKGIGVLYMKKVCDDFGGVCYGGEQETSIRPGTENVAYIAGIATALQRVHNNRERKNHELKEMTDYIMHELEEVDVEQIKPKHIAPNTLYVIMKNIKGCNKQFARDLSDKMNICVGTSSACQTGQVSHVLSAMNVDKENMNKVIRISLSDYTTMDECKYLVEKIKEELKKYRN